VSIRCALNWIHTLLYAKFCSYLGYILPESQGPFQDVKTCLRPYFIYQVHLLNLVVYLSICLVNVESLADSPYSSFINEMYKSSYDFQCFMGKVSRRKWCRECVCFCNMTLVFISVTCPISMDRTRLASTYISCL
jgi:hypothetical protein